MRWQDGFIAVDWGTTNRRAYRLDRSGACTLEFEDGDGVLKVAPGAFPEALLEIRKRLGDAPLLLAGMVGSNKGWVEAPYVRCPVAIDDLAKALVWPGESEAIVPGVAYVGEGRADVMRGEEVQLLGAVEAGQVPPDAIVCHPGTHNKWVVVEGGRIASFRTVMTGELFNLLKEHSILSDLLSGDSAVETPFRAGVRHGLDHCDVTAELFSVRARVLLGEARAEDAAAYTSGLLIGADVRTGLSPDGKKPVFIMGRRDLTALYAKATCEAGREPVELDGEQSFLSGIRAIATRI